MKDAKPRLKITIKQQGMPEIVKYLMAGDSAHVEFNVTLDAEVFEDKPKGKRRNNEAN